MARPSVTRAVLCASLVLIVLATLSPLDRSTAPVVRWCLGCGPIWLADAISNLILFAPLGAALTLCGVRVSRTVCIAATFSLAIELLQASGVAGGRTAALADVITNSTGSLAGACVVAGRALLLRPSRRAARWLLVAWSSMLLANVAITRWALAPFGNVSAVAAPAVPSTLPFTPGYGWYSALIDSASINGVAIPYRGTGAVIVAMHRTDTVFASVVVRGRDPRRSFVPMVFVHSPEDSSAHLLLGQLGDGARLSDARNPRAVSKP